MFSFIDIQPTQYGHYVFPAWATVLGWGITFISVSAIPITAVYKICQADGPLRVVSSVTFLLMVNIFWYDFVKVSIY